MFKHIKDYTPDEVMDAIAEIGVPTIQIRHYRVEGIGGHPGRLTVPPCCWWAQDPRGPWQYNDSGKDYGVEEFVMTGTVSAYYVCQYADGTLSYVERTLFEEQ